MDDADDITGCGGWSRARLIEMDANFVAAMQRALDVNLRSRANGPSEWFSREPLSPSQKPAKTASNPKGTPCGTDI